MQSGPALIQLLRTGLRPILRRENGNRDTMHLYSLGTWWAAFEGSAFQLVLRCPGAIVLPLRLKDVPYPVLAACITPDALPGCNPRREQLTLPAPALDTEKYRRWRRQKLEWFIKDLERTKSRETETLTKHPCPSAKSASSAC